MLKNLKNFTEEQIEDMFIVWTETRDGIMNAELKKTQRSAKIAYNKIGREQGHELKSYGYSRVNDAHPVERRAVGLSAFSKINVPIR